MRVRNWVISGVAVTLAALVAVIVVYRVRTAGYAEIQEVTERVATAMAAGDWEAIRTEPIFRDHPQTVDWLVARSQALATGYQVSVLRNGDGHQVLSLDNVSHLGVINTPTDDIYLGFWRDPAGGELRFVTATWNSGWHGQIKPGQ